MKVMFAIADKTTGIIRQVGVCNDVDFAAQPTGANEAAYQIPHLADPATQAIDPASVAKNEDGSLAAAIIVRATPDIAPPREFQRRRLRAACSAAITSGFTSGGKNYPSQDTDQRNLVQACVAGGNLWCATAGVWALTAHTAAQAQAALADFVTMRDAARSKLATLETSLNAASTAAAIAAVTWNAAPVALTSARGLIFAPIS